MDTEVHPKAAVLRLRVAQGWTLQRIADDELGGGSRERARQVLIRLGLNTQRVRERRKAAHCLTRHHGLRELGLKRCGRCGQTMTLAEFGFGKSRCRRCTAQTVLMLYHDPASGVKAKNLRWQHEHPELTQAARDRYIAKQRYEYTCAHCGVLVRAEGYRAISAQRRARIQNVCCSRSCGQRLRWARGAQV